MCFFRVIHTFFINFVVFSVGCLGLATGFYGCSDGINGIPQPEPLPLIGKLRHSVLNSNQLQPIILLGLDGACAGAGTVQVKSQSDTFTTEATMSGSFVLKLQARGGETLEVRYKQSLPALYTATPFTCSIEGCSPTPSPHEKSGIPPITIAENGMTIVRGETGSAIPVIGANLRSGNVSTVISKTDGSFELHIQAQFGDILNIYTDGVPLSEAWELNVP
jgi:hypothetical protein